MTESRNVPVMVDDLTLQGILDVPDQAHATVVFVHGAGSSRLSPRNGYVARVLNEAGLATLLFDLLTEAEDEAYENRFDIDLLTRRLEAVVGWLRGQEGVGPLPLGLFGASTGAAAALRAAADLGVHQIAGVVSRGGRPDLTGGALRLVECPALFIVGGADQIVLGMNSTALREVASRDKELKVVQGASHLFEEPGALEEVARLASDWFVQHLVPAGVAAIR